MLLATLARAQAIDAVDTSHINQPAAIPDLENKEATLQNVATEILANYLSRRFDKTIGDDLVLMFDGTPQWLKKLIANPVMRQTIINLYDKNSSSTLLNLFIREISISGFNTEISQIATKSEFFDVFKNTMTELLTKVYYYTINVVNACLSIILCHVMKVLNKVEGSLNELILLCCRSEYTFLYSIEVLQRTDSLLCQLLDEKYADPVTSNSSANGDDGPNKKPRMEYSKSTIVFALLTIRNLLLHLEYNAVWWSSRLPPSLQRAVTPSSSHSFSSTSFSGSPATTKLEGKALFALKLVGTFAMNKMRSNPSAQLLTRDALEVLKRGTANSSDVNRIFGRLFRFPFLLIKCRI